MGKRQVTFDQLIKLFTQFVRDMSSQSFGHALLLENWYAENRLLLKKRRICVPIIENCDNCTGNFIIFIGTYEISQSGFSNI